MQRPSAYFVFLTVLTLLLTAILISILALWDQAYTLSDLLRSPHEPEIQGLYISFCVLFVAVSFLQLVPLISLHRILWARVVAFVSSFLAFEGLIFLYLYDNRAHGHEHFYFASWAFVCLIVRGAAFWSIREAFSTGYSVVQILSFLTLVGALVSLFLLIGTGTPVYEWYLVLSLVPDPLFHLASVPMGA